LEQIESQIKLNENTLIRDQKEDNHKIKNERNDKQMGSL
jgi:hypothetical protein